MLDLREYEKQKARLPCYLSPAEYEQRIKEIVDKLENNYESNKTSVSALANQKNDN